MRKHPVLVLIDFCVPRQNFRHRRRIWFARSTMKNSFVPLVLIECSKTVEQKQNETDGNDEEEPKMFSNLSIEIKTTRSFSTSFPLYQSIRQLSEKRALALLIQLSSDQIYKKRWQSLGFREQIGLVRHPKEILGGISTIFDTTTTSSIAVQRSSSHSFRVDGVLLDDKSLESVHMPPSTWSWSIMNTCQRSECLMNVCASCRDNEKTKEKNLFVLLQTSTVTEKSFFLFGIAEKSLPMMIFRPFQSKRGAAIIRFEANQNQFATSLHTHFKYWSPVPFSRIITRMSCKSLSFSLFAFFFHIFALARSTDCW